MIECNRDDENDVAWQIVREQVERFAGLDKYPSPSFDPMAFRELCMVALRADDTMQLAHVITGIIPNVHRCPTPSELASEIRNEREKLAGPTKFSYPADTTPEPLRARRQKLLDAHMLAIQNRQAELKRNSNLRVAGEDGRFKRTPARDAMDKAGQELEFNW